MDNLAQAALHRDTPLDLAYRKVIEAQDDYERLAIFTLASALRKESPEIGEFSLEVGYGDYDDPSSIQVTADIEESVLEDLHERLYGHLYAFSDSKRAYWRREADRMEGNRAVWSIDRALA